MVTTARKVIQRFPGALMVPVFSWGAQSVHNTSIRCFPGVHTVFAGNAPNVSSIRHSFSFYQCCDKCSVVAGRGRPTHGKRKRPGHQSMEPHGAIFRWDPRGPFADGTPVVRRCCSQTQRELRLGRRGGRWKPKVLTCSRSSDHVASSTLRVSLLLLVLAHWGAQTPQHQPMAH